MYTRSDGCTVLFVVRTYSGGPPDVHSANCTPNVCQSTRHTLLFGNTLWIILGCTKQPLDRCVKVLDVRCFSGPINTTLPLRVLHIVLDALRQPKCSQSVSKCCERVRVAFASFRTFVRQNSCDFVSRR